MDLLTSQIMVALLLFTICMACALIPYKFLTFAQSNTDRSQRSMYENVFSLLNCFAAGVFLATCFLDLLPEVRTVMTTAMDAYQIDLRTFPLSEFVSIFGIFLILTIEQTALVFKERFFVSRRASSHRHSARITPHARETTDEAKHLLSPQGHEVAPKISYDSTGLTTKAPTAAILFGPQENLSPTSPSFTPTVPIHPSTSLLHKICDRADHSRPCSAALRDDEDGNVTPVDRIDEIDDVIIVSRGAPSIQHPIGDISRDSGHVSTPIGETARDSGHGAVSTPTRHEHVLRDHHHHHPVHHLSADEECGHPKFRLYTLVLSLSIHSVFEGSALALQPTPASIWALFYALILHKTVVSFSLGLNLVQSHMRLWPDIVTCAAIFSSMSPLGVALSIALRASGSASTSPLVTLVSAVLQGVACGTFLYVTFFELLPHEMNVAHNRLLKVLALVLGSALVTSFILYECFYSAAAGDNPSPIQY